VAPSDIKNNLWLHNFLLCKQELVLGIFFFFFCTDHPAISKVLICASVEHTCTVGFGMIYKVAKQF
jgi:hypothetical protein